MQKTLPLAVVTVLFVLLTTLTVNAQQSNSAAETIHNSKVVETKRQPVTTKSVLSSKPVSTSGSKLESKPAKLPYENYKGITNPGLAKQEWIKDHPEEYKKALAANANNKPVVTKSTLTDDPNRSRRLPKNYDDSKTNNGTKK